MDKFSAGAHLITTATVFGASALAFAIFPFGAVVLKGIIRAKENTTSGMSILGVVLTAFGVHIIFCLFFMTAIKILDITYLEESNFFSKKIFGIFWATGRSEVFNLAGGDGSVDTLGAYSTLFLVQTIGKLIIMNIPFLVIVLGFGYGAYQANKDNYRQDWLSVLVFSFISFISVFTIYIAWAYIASFALFLPSGNLVDMISKIWQIELKI